MNYVYSYPIRDASFYDGDSMDLLLDLGFGVSMSRKCRMLGVDTPELRGGTPQQKAAGYLARDVARSFMEEGLEDDSAVFVSETLSGKFGRPLGDVVTSNGSLREHLIKERLAVPYHGQAKSDVAEAHKENLAYLTAEGLVDSA